MIYGRLRGEGRRVHVMPALGTHEAMTEADCESFFGGAVPYADVIAHDWREGVVRLGEVPASLVAELSGGRMDSPIPVEVNGRIVGGDYGLIVSIGQVVPHEVAGMANHSKNVFVGCGGSGMINATHMLGAAIGLEGIVGLADNPVRRVLDYAAEGFLGGVPLRYVHTVVSSRGGPPSLRGVYCGDRRDVFERAAELSSRVNVFKVADPPMAFSAYLDPGEFKSMWLGNKAIYRARKAIPDGGVLYVLAGGVRRFGEDPVIDGLIRKYGYAGRDAVLSLCKAERDLGENLSAAAHLIHGSTDGRFSVVYCTRHLTKGEVEGVGYGHMDYGEACGLLGLEGLSEGLNTAPGMPGGLLYHIANPALGLWERG